ncbi:hypothetical protein GCM10019016_088160 [Streptomyces prasinosporus]|uniref:Uncharacterized protein n=1 Tax=Streptomyces prasinosporus TaxID=68256 RepID=A0ABP6U4X7_9ACTN
MTVRTADAGAGVELSVGGTTRASRAARTGARAGYGGGVASAPSGPARSGPSPTTPPHSRPRGRTARPDARRSRDGVLLGPRGRQLPAPARLPGRPAHGGAAGAGAGAAPVWSVRTVGTW